MHSLKTWAGIGSRRHDLILEDLMILRISSSLTDWKACSVFSTEKPAVYFLCGCYRVNVAVTGYMWLLLGLCGCYRVYVDITGSMWMLQGPCGCYRDNVAVTGSMWLLQGICGCYRVYVAVTGTMWLLQGLCGVTGSMWLLWGLCPPLFHLVWLLRDSFKCRYVWPQHNTLTKWTVGMCPVVLSHVHCISCRQTCQVLSVIGTRTRKALQFLMWGNRLLTTLKQFLFIMD